MSSVRNVLHIRTGQRAAAEAIDAWLYDHGVDVLPFSDVYDACTHLLKGYESVPDLALVGTDWLSEDECRIIRYVRETWPRVGLIIYGLARDTFVADFSPLSRTCRSQHALQRLLAQSPHDVLRDLTGESASYREVAPPPEPEPAPPTTMPELSLTPRHNKRDERTTDDGDDSNGQHDTVEQDQRPPERLGDVPEVQPPRAILTAEELSALLDAPDER